MKNSMEATMKCINAPEETFLEQRIRDRAFDVSQPASIPTSRL